MSIHVPDRLAFDVPMLHVPGRVPAPLVLLIAVVLLAGLDMLGAVAAKNWSEQRTFPWFASGALVFVVLFWVYGSVLRVAELSVVTLGWIVLLQVGVVILDHVHYSVQVTPPQAAAIALILVLQGYLVLSVGGQETEQSPTVPPIDSSAASAARGERVGAGTPWYAQERTLAMRLGRMG